MKKFLFLLVTFFILVSCTEKLNVKSEKAAQKNEAIFKSISSKWQFNFPSTSPSVQSTLNNWNHWEQFKKELEQKPKTSLLAFKMKSKNVALRADSLSLSVPSEFNIPQVRSRLITLNTKLNALETYLNLQDIPEKKVFSLITEINAEIKGVYGQWNEIVVKKAIPREIGEDEMIKALDTSRFANSKFLEKSMSKPELEKKK
jgi:hypothetical protein